MKNSVKNGFVEVPVMTLNALKGLLFGNEGTDLSSIINDLKPNEDDELTAINVGLVFKGLTPKIDKTTRFSAEYSTLYRYEFVGFSLILGVVKVRISTKQYSTATRNWRSEWTKSDEISIYGFDQWLGFSTDETETSNIIVKRFAPKEEKKSSI